MFTLNHIVSKLLFPLFSVRSISVGDFDVQECVVILDKQQITQSFGVLGCDPAKQTLIFLGGKDERDPYDVSRYQFLRLRYNIVAIPFLGYPGSGGSVPEGLTPIMFSSVAQAAQQVVGDALERLKGVYGTSVVVEDQVILCGYSIGAGVALRVASCRERAGEPQFHNVRCIAPFTTATFKRTKRVLYRILKKLGVKAIACILGIFCGVPSAIYALSYPVFKFAIGFSEADSDIFSLITGVGLWFVFCLVSLSLLWQKAKKNGVTNEDVEGLVKQEVSFELVYTDEVCNYDEILNKWMPKENVTGVMVFTDQKSSSVNAKVTEVIIDKAVCSEPRRAHQYLYEEFFFGYDRD